MRDFGSDNRSRGGRDFPRRSFGGRDSSNRSFSLHDAVCDECGKNCQVPFRPSGGKPIYCSDCFEKKGGRDNNRSGGRDFSRQNSGSFGSGSDNSSQLIERIDLVNSKLDTIIRLMSPAQDKKMVFEKVKVEKKPVKKKAKAKTKAKTK